MVAKYSTELDKNLLIEGAMNQINFVQQLLHEPIHRYLRIEPYIASE